MIKFDSQGRVTVFILRIGLQRDKNGLKFTFENNEIVSVSSFKYLGVTVSHNGKFKECQMVHYNQVSKGMFSVLSKSRKLELTICIQLDLFDRMILPILWYGCGI